MYTLKAIPLNLNSSSFASSTARKTKFEVNFALFNYKQHLPEAIYAMVPLFTRRLPISPTKERSEI